MVQFIKQCVISITFYFIYRWSGHPSSSSSLGDAVLERRASPTTSWEALLFAIIPFMYKTWSVEQEENCIFLKACLGG